ncbi:MAG: 2-C-methyl-D-erythritol 2,4-cyclodiphosphate synthase [Puniceicoccales bacterium]|jgi:2-C-methyl-D-erythritol 2,4-cyclodiphosphate synthase|nr:2-C-methyl-D-erythritol 2,4-cyclodiphosphate synthase [Puniceicoccales bacterium]
MNTFPPYRIGTGYDIHPLKAGRRCVLGGVEIPSSSGPDGHSDADVLCHAIADAILGAGGLCDIGFYFPNTDLACKDMNSLDILRRARDETAALGYAIQNVDATIIAECPKIAPYITAIKESLAATLALPVNCIGVKATTNEKLGSIGAGLGIAVHAVCLLARTRDDAPPPQPRQDLP